MLMRRNAAFVPDVLQLRQISRRFIGQPPCPLQHGFAHALTPAGDTGWVRFQGFEQQIFLGIHDTEQIFETLAVMTRGEAIKDFFCKTILPVAAAALLYCIFRSACVKNGELDYLWLWILCGLPFGIWRLRLWIIPGGGSLGSGIALFALNFILAGIIGGFVLVWRLIVAAWYVPLTVYRLIVGQL